MRSASDRLRRTARSGSTGVALAGTAGLLLALALVSKVFYRLVQLDEPAYRSASITFAALGTRYLVVLLLIPAALVVWRWRGLGWSDVAEGRLVRVLVLAASGTLVVSLAFYEPNWFLGQHHLVDRALLVGLFVLSAWRPIAQVPFVILATVMASQFAIPLGRYTWNDKRVVLDVLILFCLAAGAGIVRRREGIGIFIGAVGVLLASWYLVAAAGKITSIWPAREKLANMTRSAHLAGWLPEGGADSVAELVGGLNNLLVLAAIAVEVAVLLLLVGRRPAVAALLALPGLHLAVFLLSGIFFWKWMVLEVALMVLLLRCDRQTLSRFGLPLVLLALPFAFFSPRLFNVATLAWYDTPYTINLELEAVGASGTVYRVDRDDLSPYDVLLAQGRLGFVAKPGMLVGSSGVALDWDVASTIERARSPDDLAKTERRFARSQYDEEDALVFDRFVRARFSDWVAQPPLRPPHHIWTGSAPAFLNVPPVAFSGQEEVSEVRVRMHKVWWDGQRYRPLADCIVRAVQISEPLTPSYVAPDTACGV